LRAAYESARPVGDVAGAIRHVRRRAVHLPIGHAARSWPAR